MGLSQFWRKQGAGGKPVWEKYRPFLKSWPVSISETSAAREMHFTRKLHQCMCSKRKGSGEETGVGNGLYSYL